MPRISQVIGGSGSGISFLKLYHTVTSGEATSGIITIPYGATYNVGDNSLDVYQNGQLLTVLDDYAETDLATITCVTGRLTVGDVLVFKGWISL